VLDSTEESFDELIATNLKGPHFLTREAARWMAGAHTESQTTAGRIIFITSISAYAVSVNRAEYCISKAGLKCKELESLWDVDRPEDYRRLEQTGLAAEVAG